MASPIQRYRKDNSDRWEGLTDIPTWEVDSITNFIKGVLIRGNGKRINSRYIDTEVVRHLEKKYRIDFSSDLGLDVASPFDLEYSLHDLVENDIDNFLLLLEMLIVYVREGSKETKFGDGTLDRDKLLNYVSKSLENGSKWTVILDKGSDLGLIERTNSELLEIAKELREKDLEKAWGYAFGREPDPRLAIEHAQLAIESVATEVGLSNEESSVYGKLLGDLKHENTAMFTTVAKPEFDLSTKLMGAKSTEPSINNQYMEWMWLGMQLIQKSNPKRHAGKSTKNFEISVGAARQAVLISTVICELIRSGYVYKPQSDKT